MHYKGLDKPRSQAYYWFWRAVFCFAFLLIILTLWWASTTVDYVWRWNRVPQYFWLHESQNIFAEEDGTLQQIILTTPESRIVIRGNSGHELDYQLPAHAVTLLSEGDTVYKGDILAHYEQNRPGILLQGMWITLKVSAMAIVLGIILGIGTGLCRLSDNPALRWGAITYIEIIRGSPLMVQIFLWYFVFGELINQLLYKAGLSNLDPLLYGVLALAVFTGAYTAEIVRAGIQSVHKGQTEAARSLGMTHAQCMRKIVLPQAFRRIMPPLAGQFISLIKDSSLLGVIAVRELTKSTREVVTSSLQPFEMWIVCALLYLVLTFTLSVLIQYLERRAIIR